MSVSTAERLVAAAAELLDRGGEAAVTLRAVGAAIGVSHNAPYKHFASRDDLLAAVATADFAAMADEWRKIRTSPDESPDRLVRVLDVAIRFAQDHPARYRLLFNSPELATREGPLKVAATDALKEFTALVEEQQAAGLLPAAPPNHLAIVLFATAHGLIDADASGRLRPKTGWTTVTEGVELLIRLVTTPDK
jgi:AcrR family transcriptional regulator